jgi:lipid-binding SYLF domain-containing protein
MSCKTIPLLLVLMTLYACAWPPIATSPPSENEQQKAYTSLKTFKNKVELSEYFDRAVAYAVFPNTVRGGAGFGGAYGYGWVFYKNELIGRTSTIEVSVGVNIGAQWYQQILFFKTEESFQRFRRGGFEFAGQAHTAAASWGASGTPSYHSEIALFTELKSGLLVEASVGTHRLDFAPFDTKKTNN